MSSTDIEVLLVHVELLTSQTTLPGSSNDIEIVSGTLPLQEILIYLYESEAEKTVFIGPCIVYIFIIVCKLIL